MHSLANYEFDIFFRIYRNKTFVNAMKTIIIIDIRLEIFVERDFN